MNNDAYLIGGFIKKKSLYTEFTFEKLVISITTKCIASTFARLWPLLSSVARNIIQVRLKRVL